MTYQEKAEKAVKLLEEAVVELLQSKEKMRLRQIDESLRLDFDICGNNRNIFIQKFIESYVMERHQNIRTVSEGEGNARYYYWSEV